VTDPNVLVGINTADDAAVYRVNDTLALIQTVDFFTPIVDDPYTFGAIAAVNSLSDVYAMGGRPVLALNVVGFPRNRPGVPLTVLSEILRGGAEKAKEAGIDIVGGHTVDDQEPKYGLSVTGFVHPDKIWRNVGARPGDALIVTKALGTGIISTAIRAGEAPVQVEEAATHSMLELNKAAAEAAQGLEVHACTDITGFGLLGHLLEMLGDDLGVRVINSAIPVLEGVRALADAGYAPGGSRRNAKAHGDRVRFEQAISEVDRLILSDAQTSGGLLFAVPPSQADRLLSNLRAANVAAAQVGVFTESPPGIIEMVA